jgi:hypothetical protein
MGPPGPPGVRFFILKLLKSFSALKTNLKFWN